jgi:hypothetical protein
MGILHVILSFWIDMQLTTSNTSDKITTELLLGSEVGESQTSTSRCRRRVRVGVDKPRIEVSAEMDEMNLLNGECDEM